MTSHHHLITQFLWPFYLPLYLPQLDTLFKRSLHKLALDLATAQQADAGTVAGIHQRWGDHLYGKGEYDAAMGQYLDTIGHLEPSYVIRRYIAAASCP